ncbi:hypothetical protein MMC30_003711 [Trapelia coarctata]|nr:hypothetical protein [Trapelia coarctata]
MYRETIKLHRKHGKLVRTGPNEVSVADLAAIKMVYDVQGAGTKFGKKRDEKVHGSQRRLVSRIYSLEALQDLEEYVDDAIRHFVAKMQEQAGTPIDFGLWAQLFAFDVIGEITFSKRFGFMDAGKDDGSIVQIESALHSAAWIGQVPWLYWLHDSLIPLLGNRLGIGARHGSLRTFASQEIQDRMSRGTDHQDILAKLFAVQKEKPNEMNDMGVISMATSNIFAGSDTTAISIRSIVYHLCKNPQYKRKLVDEIDLQQQTGKLSIPAKLKEAKNMPYLQACLYEGLRCHPAVGMSLPRVRRWGVLRSMADIYLKQ